MQVSAGLEQIAERMAAGADADADADVDGEDTPPATPAPTKNSKSTNRKGGR
ncbi:hypothetical protein D3C71_2215770 [compost metagenome]